MADCRRRGGSQRRSPPRRCPAERRKPGAALSTVTGPSFRELEISGVAKELARNAELVRFEDGCFELVVPKAMPHLAERVPRKLGRRSSSVSAGRCALRFDW